MKKIFPFLFLLWATAFSQNLSNIPGAFTDIGYGVRPMGMGGAYTALANDANAVIWNPAGLLQVRNPNGEFMFARQFDLIPYFYSVYAQPLKPGHMLGFGLIYNGDDVYSETSGMVSYAFYLGQFLPPAFKGLAGGATLTYRHASFGNNSDGGIGQVKGSANGASLQIGLLWRWSREFAIGATVKEIASLIRWNSSTDEGYQTRGSYNEGVPYQTVIGFLYQPTETASYTVDFQPSFHLDTISRFSFGMEQKFLEILSVRGGLTQHVLSPEPDRNFMLGIGLEPALKNSRLQPGLHFAYLVTEPLGNTLRISLTLRWLSETNP